MNKIIGMSFVALLLFLGTTFIEKAHARYVGPGQQTYVMTVEEVLNAPDDTAVALEGALINQLGVYEYLFQDENGDTIIVEIDEDMSWPAMIDEATLIFISGEVDTEKNAPNIVEIDNLQILQD